MDINSPDIRYFRIRNKANTHTLVEDVTHAARIAAACTTWPAELPAKDAARLAHSFAASAVRYDADMGTQTIRMPWRSVNSQGDCKSTAILIASLCAAAGRDVVLRFLQYEPGPTWYAHVFAVVDGIPVDPLLPYGEQYDYLRKTETRISHA